VLVLKLVLLLGVVLLVVAIGLRARLEQPLLLLRRPALALRALVAMYLFLPALVLALVWMLPLQAGVGAVLLGLAVSPVLPPWARKGAALGARSDYVIGLQVLSSAVALLVIPVMLWIVEALFGVQVSLRPLAVEQVLLVTVALPLAVGMVLARLTPAAAPRLASRAERWGGVLLLLGLAVLLPLQLPAILGVLGQGTLALILAVVALGLLIGHLLGGPEPAQRAVLASAVVHRHPAVALLLAMGSGTAADASVTGTAADASVTGTVLLYMLVALLLPIPYERWRRRLVGAA